MVSSIELVVAGLSTGHKVGLAVVGAAFIAFALISAFVLPRRNPNFPGKHLGLYIVVCVLFFVAMISAVLIFGRESSEAEASTTTAAATTQTTSTTTSTQTTPTTTSAQTTPAPPPQTTTSQGGTTAGDAAAGKQVFTTAGCSGCHTLKDAGATGTVGPNLDQLKPSDAIVVHQVTNGGGVMPAFKNSLTPKQIADVAAYVSSVAGK